jgi:hypothetical protein
MFLKIDIQVDLTNIGGYDESDPWSRDSYSGDCWLNNVSIVSTDEYDTIETLEDYAIGDEVFIVWAVYTTGDSFGTDGGNYELISAHKTYEDAEKSAQIADSENSPFSRPWCGYFESLDSMNISPKCIGY